MVKLTRGEGSVPQQGLQVGHVLGGVDYLTLDILGAILDNE